MHSRLTALATTAAATAVALSGFTAPAKAEAVVYDSYGVQSNPPNRPGHEYATVEIPTGYDVDRLDWHTTVFFENVEQGRAIHVDLHPKSDTVRELRQERAELKEQYADSYEEFAFQVNDKDSKVRVLWSYTFTEPGTGDVDPLVSVMLMSANQVKVVGTLDDRDRLRSIREHVRDSAGFPS